jgi:hypothetical protein
MSYDVNYIGYIEIMRRWFKSHPATNAIIELRAIGHLQHCPNLSDKGNCHTVPIVCRMETF